MVVDGDGAGEAGVGAEALVGRDDDERPGVDLLLGVEVARVAHDDPVGAMFVDVLRVAGILHDEVRRDGHLPGVLAVEEHHRAAVRETEREDLALLDEELPHFAVGEPVGPLLGKLGPAEIQDVVSVHEEDDGIGPVVVGVEHPRQQLLRPVLEGGLERRDARREHRLEGGMGGVERLGRSGR